MDLKDPAAFRALAHPLRLELFERLAILGTATASQLADHVDESPANCSFHLRVLAKHGYIERVESADGRERPWRVIDVSQSWESDQPVETRVAKEALEDALIEWDTARLRQSLRMPVPERWKGTMLHSRATLWLTPEETRTISDAIVALITPYIERWGSDDRPADGVPVRVLTEMFLVPGDPADAGYSADAGAPTDAGNTDDENAADDNAADENEERGR